MSAACQKDSYLREFVAEVLSCEPGSISADNGPITGYNVILSDTVLFPEGGGQPDDRGLINDVPVLRVTIASEQIVHFTSAPLDTGSSVKVCVDWKRRFDHMQQHSGQHLITAVAEAEFGYKTTSWCNYPCCTQKYTTNLLLEPVNIINVVSPGSLGERLCRIEMDTKGVSPEQLEKLEELCNKYILEGRSMYPTYYDSIDDPALAKVRGRGLPDGVTGPIRVMTIDGLDVNLCCGTHVSSLAHLQAIKLLGTEKGKKSCTNIVFLAGQRVLNSLGTSITLEKNLNTYLKGAPSDFPDLVKKLQNLFKVANKNSTNLLREIVIYEADKFSSEIANSGQKFFIHHKKEGDGEYMNSLLQKVECADDVLKFVTVGDDKGPGSFLLQGPVDLVSELGPKIAEIIDGKGAGKNGKFQGKANKLSQKHKIEQLLKEATS